MSENMRIWEAVCRPPATALKRIAGGRLKGMTDINPQWRIQMMTERFGPIGTGWYYDVLNKWTEPGAGDEVLCFVDINVYIKDGGEWSKPIYGLGGSKLVSKESGGMYSNDEGYKMALTDALSVAMKELGVAADIYKGLWDGSKYIVQEENDPVKVEAVSIWLELCEKASGSPLEKFKKWWLANKNQILKECGAEGAAEVYKAFTDYLTRLRKEVEDAGD